MKRFIVAPTSMRLAVVVHLLVLACPAAGARLSRTTVGDHPITKVVKMLEAMLGSSRTEGDEEKKLYAKHQCYCDDNEEQKKQAIDSLTSQIEMLASEMDGLRASTAIASQAVAKIQARMEEIALEQEKLTEIRKQEAKEYSLFKEDMETAIDMAESAIKELAKVGADQSSFGAAADHAQYMADFPAAFVSLKKVLSMAVATGKKEAATKLGAFLELKGPFTGTYAAQSGEVVGILKSMRDEFQAELSSATEVEKKAIETFDAIMAALKEEDEALEKNHQKEQGTLESNDSKLATMTKEKAVAEEELADAKDFLENLLDLCAKKTKEYNKRVDLRTAEETAIAEAIAILNSDAAFESFGKVAATGGEDSSKSDLVTVITGHPTVTEQPIPLPPKAVPLPMQIEPAPMPPVISIDPPPPVPDGPPKRTTWAWNFESDGFETNTVFTQIASVITGSLRTSDQARSKRALEVLHKAATEQKSRMIARIAALLEADNPFTTVIDAIDEMLKALTDEGALDEKKVKWCFEEREKKNEDLDEANSQIATLEKQIDTLVDIIDNPVTGLNSKIKATEGRLADNVAAQTSETAQRTQENLVYQKDIGELVEAKDLISKALTVLEAYYKEAMKTDGTGFIQTTGSQPETWDTYAGQSDQGNTAITQLAFILKNTETEEAEAHSAEGSAQREYEKSMTDLKEEEKADSKLLAEMQEELAEKEKELLDKRKDLKGTEEVRDSIEAYLLEIKPGCDFITNNLALRDRSRQQETKALTNAKTLLMGTPAYKEAVMTAHNETLGKCADICHNNEEHVDCKACVADVSVPGYCAGHAGTEGC